MRRAIRAREAHCIGHEVAWSLPKTTTIYRLQRPSTRFLSRSQFRLLVMNISPARTSQSAPRMLPQNDAILKGSKNSSIVVKWFCLHSFLFILSRFFHVNLLYLTSRSTQRILTLGTWSSMTTTCITSINTITYLSSRYLSLISLFCNFRRLSTLHPPCSLTQRTRQYGNSSKRIIHSWHFLFSLISAYPLFCCLSLHTLPVTLNRRTKNWPKHTI